MTTEHSIPYPRAGTFALVTGASSGIGEALALELGRRGHDLILVARSTGPMEAIAEQLPGRDVRIRSVDLSDAAARAELIAEVEDLDVNILINSAGIATFGDFTDLDYEISAGKKFGIEDLKEILAVDKKKWAKEAEELEGYYTNTIKTRIPAELLECLDTLKKSCAK